MCSFIGLVYYVFQHTHTFSVTHTKIFHHTCMASQCIVSHAMAWRKAIAVQINAVHVSVYGSMHMHMHMRCTHSQFHPKNVHAESECVQMRTRLRCVIVAAAEAAAYRECVQ